MAVFKYTLIYFIQQFIQYTLHNNSPNILYKSIRPYSLHVCLSLHGINIFFPFQSLEDEFAYQLEEQERHYGHYLTAALGAEAAASEIGAAAAGLSGGSRKSSMDRKASSKSSGSDRSAGSSSRKSSYDSRQQQPPPPAPSSSSSSRLHLSTSRHSLLSSSK
jgi:hypothetical protein